MALRDYEIIDHVAVGEEKYYIINLETKDVNKVNENEVYKFYQVSILVN